MLGLAAPGINSAYEIQGRVSVTPPYPGLKKIQVKKKHHDACAGEQISQSLIVSENGFVKNAVVSLKGNFEKKAGTDFEIPVLDQKDCNFQPHILIAPGGKPFHVANSDPMDHDVRIFDEADMLLRFEMDAYDKPVEKQLRKAGTYVVRCGLHPWMHAFVVSAEHPYYAVSDQNGEFRFTGVPPGRYHLHIWHETLGEGQIPVEVEKDISEISYTFRPVG